MKLVECVPNFSEGRNKKVINEIVEAIKSVEGIEVLDVDPGYDTNRTVVTFIGAPEAVVEAAFRGIKKASELIDMRKHKGAHPRMGATDVCPLIPLKDISEEECVELSHKLAKRVGEELGIPVYLYEKSATKPERKNLAVIREGEYEGLKEKIKKPEWKPDYGPAEFNPKSGATVIGVREFLIAYNINLNTREKRYATDIAFELREKGRTVRKGNTTPFYFKGEIVRYKKGYYPCGSCDFVGKNIKETIKHCKKEHGYDLKELLKSHNIDPDNPEGRPVKKPGKFKECKAIGWYVDDYKRAQISINLTNYKITNMHHVYDEAKRLADERGVVVTGSEIVGLVPFNALFLSGNHYLKKQKLPEGFPLSDVLETAIQSLGLRDVTDFDVNKKVLGLPDVFYTKFGQDKIQEFLDKILRPVPVPGGGSASALSGAIGSSLIGMALNITITKLEDYKKYHELSELSVKFRDIRDFMIVAIDKDSEAFEKLTKEGNIKIAIEIPLSVMGKALEALSYANKVMDKIDRNVFSDFVCGILNLNSCVYGAYMNVLINLTGLDGKEKKYYKDRGEKIMKEFTRIYEKLFKNCIEILKENVVK